MKQFTNQRYSKNQSLVKRILLIYDTSHKYI
mgnify:CR=1 FL=1|jgi:hypothetical protein